MKHLARHSCQYAHLCLSQAAEPHSCQSFVFICSVSGLLCTPFCSWLSQQCSKSMVEHSTGLCCLKMQARQTLSPPSSPWWTATAELQQQHSMHDEEMLHSADRGLGSSWGHTCTAPGNSSSRYRSAMCSTSSASYPKCCTSRVLSEIAPVLCSLS